MLVFRKKQIFCFTPNGSSLIKSRKFFVLLTGTALLAVLFLLLTPQRPIKAAGFEESFGEVCRGLGAIVCGSGLECDSTEDICLGSNGYVCQGSDSCANGLLCLDGKCAVDFGAGQGEKLDLGKSTNDIRDQIRTFINIFLGFLGVLGVLMVMYAGWLWMTSRGNAEQVKKAKQTLTYAVLGILVILLSWTITSYILYLGQQGGGSGSGGSGGNGPPILPPEPPGPSSLSLEIEKFGTQHQGQDPQIAVHPSCGINIDFNLYVDPISVDKAKNVNLPSPLRVEKADGSGMAVRDFLTTANRVTYPPIPPGLDLAVNTDYQIVLPGILDTEEHPALKNNTQQYLLQNCQGDLQNVCNIIGNDIYWKFTTASSIEDFEAVALNSTAPADQARNTPTYPVITLKFDGELFAPSFLDGSRFKDNIQIWQTNNGECKISEPDCLVADSPVSMAENWEARLDGQTASFYYRPMPRAELEPFSWYYFQADNILDLCGQKIIGNVQDSQTKELTNQIVIRFQVGEGAKFIIYPPNGADTLCTGNVPIYAQSTISLFDPTIGQCGYNVNGFIEPSVGRVLDVQDPGIGGCTQYNFLPQTALVEEKTYQVQVKSDFDITENEKLKIDWQFSTKTIEQCDNPPAITQISPNAGSKGQCLGIIGYNFKGKTNFAGENQDKNLIHFEKKDSPDDYFDQTYKTILTSPEIIGSWSDNNIVTIFPKDKDIFAKNDQIIISMQRYSEIVGETLITADNPIFTLSEEQIINKPLCLIAIELANPKALALAGEKIKLTGRNFSDENLTPHENCDGKKNCVKFNNDTLIVPSYYWTDVSAESTIPGQATTGGNLVFVHKIINPGAQDIKSNGYLFTVDLPPPEKPRIVYYSGCANGRFQTPSPYPGKIDVCLIKYNNDDKRIIFFLEYDRKIDAASTIFSLKDCGQADDPNCQNKFIGQKEDYKIEDNQPVLIENNEGVKITMLKGNLSPNTWYQPKISGIKDETDSNISADDYIWSFKTNNQICAIDSVSVSLNPKTINYSYDSSNTSATVATPISDTTCQQLDNSLFTWDWLVEDAQIAFMDPADTDQDANNTAKATGKKGQTNIKAVEEKTGKEGVALLEVTIGDPTLCDPHQLDECLQECPGSQCKKASDEKFHCTPVINTLSPTEGAVGTWLEINGCYFGEQQGKVDFNGEADGIFDKFPMQCSQNLWTNEKILTEAPAMDLGIKPVKVITTLELTSNANQKFNLTDDPFMPQLCSVIPDNGKAETDFTAYGKFNYQAVETMVFIGDKKSDGHVNNNGEQITTAVAQGAPTGEQVVKVIQDGNESPQEHIKFTVIPGDPPITPEQTFIKILDYSPKTDNVCQNAVVSVKFDSRMNFTEGAGDITAGKVILNGPECLLNTPPFTKRKNFYISYILNLWQRFFPKAQANGDCGVWQFKGDSHKEIKIKQAGKYLGAGVYTIKIKGGAEGVKSEDDKILNKDNCGKGIWQDPYCLYTFSGGTDTCEADRVSINSDAGEVFVYNVNYDHSKPPAGSYADLTATGYFGDTEIDLVKPYYSNIDWEVIKKNDLIRLADNNPAADAKRIAYAVKKEGDIIQGSDVIKAVVKVGEKELTDTIIATLALCGGDGSQYFWKFNDPNDIAQDVNKNRPTEGLDDAPGNFSLSYCRYREGEPPLPLLGKDDPDGPVIQIVFPPVSQKEINKSNDILKEYYFRFTADPNSPAESPNSEANFLKQPYAKDFFILRIMPNWKQDYLSAWFDKEQNNLTGIDIPFLKTKITKQSSAAYAYQQADGGNILFVNALNLVKTDPEKNCDQTDCKIFTNIYILSYNKDNKDAQTETKNIFNQLKTNWQFNNNFYRDSEFIIEGVTEEQIQRDWQRIRDLNVMAASLEAYKGENNKYPLEYSVSDYDPISRVPGLAVSAWQSEWQEVLANKLKNFLSTPIPIDPLVNKVQCQDIQISPAPKSPKCSVEKKEKLHDYYCRPAVDCKNAIYNSLDNCATAPAGYCQWVGDATAGSCQSTDINTGTYVYQYQLTGDCYIYDEAEVKCNISNLKDNIKSNCISPCVWHDKDKDRNEGRCESICSDSENTFKDKADDCLWKAEDQRCYSTAQNYDLYANFEYSPAPWCNAKDAQHCQEYKFCQSENDQCLSTQLDNNQPYCAGDQVVFDVLYTSE